MSLRVLHSVHRFLILAAVSIALAAPAFAQTGRVAGVVKDENGQPIKGATVTAENPTAVPKSFTATTDEKGRFSLIGLAKGNWTFTVTAPGHAPVEGRAEIATLRPNPPLEFKLPKGPSGPPGLLAGVNAKELQADLQAADAMMAAEQYDQAIEAYQKVLQKAPALTVINLQIGDAYLLKKDYDRALAAYQQVLKGDPNNERAIVKIGMANLAKGDLTSADETLTAAANTASAGREVFYNLGEVKFAEGQADEAAKWYQKAIDTDPAWGKPLVKLALVSLNKGDKDGALKLLEKAAEVDPNSPEAAQAKQMIEQLKK